MTPPILCGTDFSENAMQAADAAAALAVRLRAKLILAHSLDERGEIPVHLRPQLRAGLEPPLAAEAARVRALGVEVEERLIAGVPDDGLLALAAGCSARLIVLAASGSGALGRWMLGSVAERTAESAPIPTLVVRAALPLVEWARGTRPLRVLAGVDFTANSEAALRWLADIRQIGPCAITLGFVDRDPDEGSTAPEDAPDREDALRAMAREILGDEPLSVFVRASSARIDAHLLQLADEWRADLIVTGTHQWRGMQRLRHTSVSRRLLRDAAVSVACIPDVKTQRDD